MKHIFFLFLFVNGWNVFGQTLSRDQLRVHFLQASERKTALDSFIHKLENINKKTPAEECYFGICNGICCQYDESNWSKFKHVVKAKNALNSAVEKDSKDPELRFMRFMLEHFLPSFLGFNKHIDEDIKVIFSNPNFIDENLALKKKVIEFLIWTKRCTAEQTKVLEAKIKEINKKLEATGKKS
jgi:hypothetical protein